ncbi:MAG: histidine ammonia-lyase [Legionellaceae bacterium]|nr:histidine ammonia-lyase [Legionellaceae bacterium]
MATPHTIMPGALTLLDLPALLSPGNTISLDESCFASIERSADTVQNVIQQGKTVYGINTGFGSLANQCIADEALGQLQKNILLSHACGTGNLLSDEIVKLVLLLKINNLAQGYSGVRRAVIDFLIALYNHEILPCIPAKGSVGASGDLVPLAHMALPLIGEGEVRFKGDLVSSRHALTTVGLRPLQLGPKEGLALLNGVQVSTAIAVSAFLKTETLFTTAVVAGALSLDAAQGSDVPFDDRIHQVRGFRAQQKVASMYRSLLQGSAIRDAHRHCERVQDPYSLRCQPQVMGAILHQMEFVGETLQTEMNAVSDNPLVFSDEGDILSGGNFHGEIVAMAADNLALAIAEMGALSERRIALLIDKHFSQLPAFLVQNGGLHSGFMIAHVTAASCASDNKALAHPHCVDSIPTSANQEDHVSMATSAARRLHEMLDNCSAILAIEVLAACQGLDFRKPLETSPMLMTYVNRLRARVEVYTVDRYFAPDIAIVKHMVNSGDFAL